MSAQIPGLHAPDLESRITPGLEIVERRLPGAASSSRDLTDGLIRYLAVAGGKHMRPLLALVCAQLGEPECGLGEQVTTATTAVELTHLASLYHDDVTDLAPTRRGVPSTQHLQSNNRAILASDILFARASLLVASLGPEMVAHHTHMFKCLHEGQFNEIFGSIGGADRVDFYLQILADKTGSLVSTAAFFDMFLSGAGQLMADVMSDFGEKVGVAFQIADNVLDLASPDEWSGKMPGTDLRKGVDTLLVLPLRHREAADTIDKAGARILHEPTGNLSLDEALASVIKQLRNYDILEETRGLTRAWANDVVATLVPLPKGEARTALEAFANLMVDCLV